MLRFGQRIGVAVSGGADSVFLLRTLVDLGLATAVFHVNHQLRGGESDEDEAFVRALSESFGLPVFVRQSPVTAGNVEQTARRARYEFFKGAVEAGLVDAVATGHTLDDQAETVLYRFLRGSGTAGLSGIRPVSSAGVVRPLLLVSREGIREHLRTHHVAWREDSSNLDANYARNRIRQQVLPLVDARVLASMAEWARAEEDYWQEQLSTYTRQLFRMAERTVIFPADEMENLPVAVQRRLIRRAVEIVRGDLRSIDFQHVEAIRELFHVPGGSGRLQLPDVDIMRSFEWIRLTPLGWDNRLPRNFETILAVPGTTNVEERGLVMSLEPLANTGVYNRQVNVCDQDLCAGTLLLRNWQPGDHIVQQGSFNPEKLKSLFQKFRIPLWERRGWPVITLADGTVVWARRFGVSAAFAPGPESTRLLSISEPAPDPAQVTESKRVFPASIEVKRAPSLDPRSSGRPGAEVL